ncbi:MAG TPA: tetratricopeptide repeat protein [Gammaproteobacteria bacterium]|nr:tetratricopeptide repeat protein [Gammaproteobacteria bacterium]
MTAYLNEEEQVEALKNWWKENGRSVVIGVVLGFAAIFGWKGWQGWQQSRGEAASALYENMLVQLAGGNREGALAAGKRLLGEYDGSVYASFAALKMAQLSYRDGKPESALTELAWVEEHAPDAVLVDLARLRQARLLVDAGKWDQAAARLQAIGKDFMPAAVAELRGDVARGKGDLAAARAAYEEAIAAGAADPLVRMKLQEIGSGEQAS